MRGFYARGNAPVVLRDARRPRARYAPACMDWGRCGPGDRTGGRKMRCAFIALWMLSWSVTPAIAQVTVGIGLPGASIGINLPLFPELVPVPGYPVYYAPGVS